MCERDEYIILVIHVLGVGGIFIYLLKYKSSKISQLGELLYFGKRLQAKRKANREATQYIYSIYIRSEQPQPIDQKAAADAF